MIHHLHRAGLACALALFAGVPVAAQAADTAAVADMSSCAKPEWPKESLRSRMEGTVTLEFQIDASGQVRQSKVLESSGFPLLDAAARSGLEKCRFSPAKAGGKAVDSRMKMEYVWTFKGPAPKAAAPAPEPFAAASAPVRAFLLAAKKADAITDPLQRCLAFPDFPGNEWPPGLARAYCHMLYGAMITRQVIADHVDRGAFAALEAMYRRDLKRHFSKNHFSEVIHRDFASFNIHPESERLSRIWLEKAPRSPFANLARAEYLTEMARQARGDKWYKDTPQADRRRMEELAVPARALYEQALKLEPRLEPALIGLMYLDSFAGDGTVGEAAFKRAVALDPACRYLSKIRMIKLEPRWGGSMYAMHAYARQLQHLVKARPLVALSIVMPALHEANNLTRDHKYKEAIAVSEPAALLAPYPDLFNELGRSIVEADGSSWDALVRLLVAYRFDDDAVHGARVRGTLMVEGHDPAWALKSLQRGVELAPDSFYANYWLGKAYMELKKDLLAEPFLSKALADGDEGYRRHALYNLGYATLNSVQLEKAEAHSALFVKTYPKDPSGWILRGRVKTAQGEDKEAAAAYTTFLGLVKKGDSQWADQVAYAQWYLSWQVDAKQVTGETPAK